jgi:ABC-type Mn2+/Zn2+ transport system ATPase subunit
VALDAAAGEVVAVEGPNGSGKSTLLAVAAGVLPADRSTVRPGAAGYAPERPGPAPRIRLLPWLTGLAMTAGLPREHASRRAASVLERLGLGDAAQSRLDTLSRGNAQRALVAQALLADPGLLVLDEPGGGMDSDGVSLVAAEIARAADRGSVVLVARHSTAPLPLPAGQAWRLSRGTVSVSPRVAEPGVPAPAADDAARDGDARDEAVPDGAARRAGRVARVLRGAAHRARVLVSSQWFAAPVVVFLAVLAAVYATDAGAPLTAAALTATVLAPLLTWICVLAHRADGPELSRAFTAHIGGRGRGHLAASLAVTPFAVVMTVVACVWPLVTQGAHPHPASVIAETALLHAGACVLGAGLGALVVPPLVDRAGWRVIGVLTVYFLLIVAHPTPLTPLLRVAANASVSGGTLALAVAWPLGLGAVCLAVATFLADRLTPP